MPCNVDFASGFAMVFECERHSQHNLENPWLISKEDLKRGQTIPQSTESGYRFAGLLNAKISCIQPSSEAQSPRSSLVCESLACTDP